MVIKRSWKVVSGTMAAGVLFVPQSAALADDGPDLKDPVPVLEDFEFSAAETAFLSKFFEGKLVNLDFLSLSISVDSPTVDSATVTETDESETVESESPVSEPSETVESESPVSEPSETVESAESA
jgi:hypothetical protein